MLESTIVNKWKAEAYREGYEKGYRKAMTSGILLRLQIQYGCGPKDLAKGVHACEGVANLDAWFDAVFASSSLDDFRRVTGL